VRGAVIGTSRQAAAQAWLEPLDTSRFLQDSWDKKPLVIRAHDPAKFEHLWGLSFNETAFLRCATFLHGHRGAVARLQATRGVPADGFIRVSFDHEAYVEVGGTRPTAEITPEQILPFVAAGASVQLGALECLAIDPHAGAGKLPQATELFRCALQHPGDVLVGATLSPPGARFHAHFDPTAAFIIQTSGSKRYRFSRAPVVPHPLGKAYLRADGSFRYEGGVRDQQDRADWEIPAPFDAAQWEEPVELSPGDMLYLPAGVVHETLAGDAGSVAVLVIFGRTSAERLFTQLIERAFSHDPNWRHLPVWHGLTMPEEVSQFLAARIEELQRLVTSLDAHGFEMRAAWAEATGFSAAVSAHALAPGSVQLASTDRLGWDPSVPLTSAYGEDRSGTVRLIAFRGREEISVEGEDAAWMQQLVAREEFLVGEAAMLRPDLEIHDVQDFLAALVEHGILCVLSPSSPNQSEQP
jgi:quercetin dioxygenase-like cupin family protein